MQNKTQNTYGKVIDKAGNAADRMKNAYIRTKDEFKQTQQMEHNSPSDYATDNVTRGAENTVYEAGSQVKKQSAKFTKKFVKGIAKRTIKTAQKSVKSAGNAAKITIKTSQEAVKTATKTVQATAKTTKAAAQSARVAAKVAAQATKITIKATITAVKAIIASVKGLVGLIAAGGWIAIIAILVICMMAFIIASPYAIFGGGGANGTPSMAEVIGTINSEWDNKIEQLKTNAGDVDETVIILNGSVVTSSRVQNWSDVLSVYSVKTSTGDAPSCVAELDSNRIRIIKYVFNDMNAVTCKTEETTDKYNNLIKKLTIEITSKNHNDMILKYNFNCKQQEVLIELMSDKNKLLWKQITG